MRIIVSFSPQSFPKDLLCWQQNLRGTIFFLLYTTETHPVYLMTSVIKLTVHEIIWGCCSPSTASTTHHHFSFLSYLQTRLPPLSVPPSPNTHSEALCGFCRLWNPRAEWSHCSSSLWTAGWRREEGGWQEISITDTLSLSLCLTLSLARSPSLWSSRCRFGHERRGFFLRKDLVWFGNWDGCQIQSVSPFAVCFKHASCVVSCYVTVPFIKDILFYSHRIHTTNCHYLSIRGSYNKLPYFKYFLLVLEICLEMWSVSISLYQEIEHYWI